MSGDAEREWRASDISQVLYVTPGAAEEQLERMRAQGFLHSPFAGVYRYAPEEAQMRVAVRELAMVYEQLRFRVIEYIYSRPSDSVRSFAHAFRIKGDPEE